MLFDLHPKEAATATLAAKEIQRLATAAAKACEKAGVDANEAHALAGYAEEAAYRIDKREGDTAELPGRHRLALMFGLVRLANDLDKTRASLATDFLSDTTEVEERIGEINALHGKLRDCTDEQATFVWRENADDETTITLTTGGRSVTATEGEFARALDVLETTVPA